MDPSTHPKGGELRNLCQQLHIYDVFDIRVAVEGYVAIQIYWFQLLCPSCQEILIRLWMEEQIALKASKTLTWGLVSDWISINFECSSMKVFKHLFGLEHYVTVPHDLVLHTCLDNKRIRQIA
jgi:hypothetical protein